MKPNPPKRDILAWRIAALISIVLMTLVGMLLQPTPGRDFSLLIAFVAVALFLIQRKIFDARLVFALCGVGLALVFHTFNDPVMSVLDQTQKWYHSYIAIAAAYGFAALMMSEGFIKEFAAVLAEYGVGNRSNPLALFLTTSVIAFVVNAIILSAGSSCAVVAPIFVPLLIRLGFPAPVAAAAVVIGAWGGFLNPADTGGVTIAQAFTDSNFSHRTTWAMYNIPAMHMGPAILALIAANITFAFMNRKKNSHGQRAQAILNSGEVLPKGTDRIRSIIAILPLLLLIPLEFFAWLLGWNLKAEDYLSICLVGTSIAATIVVVRDSGQGGKKVLSIVKVFSHGMWKGFAEVVVLIIAAKLFISPFKNLIEQYGNNVLAFFSVPTAFVASALTGSGDAVASSLIPTVVDSLSRRLPVPPVAIPGMFASMLWLATEMGRNVSPISVATLTCARAVAPKEIDSATVARHVLFPILVAFVVGCFALYIVLKVFS